MNRSPDIVNGSSTITETRGHTYSNTFRTRLSSSATESLMQYEKVDILLAVLLITKTVGGRDFYECLRDRYNTLKKPNSAQVERHFFPTRVCGICLLYTSDAADE